MGYSFLEIWQIIDACNTIEELTEVIRIMRELDLVSNESARVMAFIKTVEIFDIKND